MSTIIYISRFLCPLLGHLSVVPMIVVNSQITVKAFLKWGYVNKQEQSLQHMVIKRWAALTGFPDKTSECHSGCGRMRV